ncbi:hydrophobic surface binding protein [Guyanagaster necrorhizus]|uniref:Hydrophobic surface binding protein n=1 Tax=Guyanagaster necrorhizus TaxID=856835 RepID=A0A9P7VTI9_9AGAR|nr:hydrophobic surface binding protein [Guyanagaster necrorhizus MCA 3950]KAG7446292.1 hydrophobic surface binding protein [Guyanagaster necrorhizus MCA 3950]
MVQIPTGLFLLLSVVTATSAIPTKRTVAQVEADIADIVTQVDALDSSINAFPATGGSLLAALAIHSSATTLISTLQTATTDTTATDAFSEDDGATILASVEAFEPTILDALTAIVAKEPAFEALPIGGIPALVLQDLQGLNSATGAFSDALIAKSPADLVDQADEIKTTIGNGFDTAIAAYSN